MRKIIEAIEKEKYFFAREISSVSKTPHVPGYSCKMLVLLLGSNTSSNKTRDTKILITGKRTSHNFKT